MEHTSSDQGGDSMRKSKMLTIPIVDMADPAAAAVISKACNDHGFFYLENHNVPEKMTQTVFGHSKAFFDLDLEDKMRLKSEMNTGYRPMDEEMIDIKNQSKGHTREGFGIFRDLDPGHAHSGNPLQEPNRWPSESLVPGWKATMKEYFETMHALAGRVTDHLAASVGVDPAVVKGCFSESMASLRLIHYSSEVSDPEKGIFGIAQHSDFGVLTLLATDEVPGLQVLLNDEWIDVHPRPGAFICNVGDMLQRWTNDHLRSTVHRVVNKTGRDRYSVAFFFAPSFDTEVACLPQFCSEEEPAKYSPTTSGKFLTEKVSALYSKKESTTK
ncbi:unnamed protein product [Ascophyllum nodosum]